MPEEAPLDQPALPGTQAQDKTRRRCYRDLVPVSLELRTSPSLLPPSPGPERCPPLPWVAVRTLWSMSWESQSASTFEVPKGRRKSVHLPSWTWHESQFCEQLRPRPV